MRNSNEQTIINAQVVLDFGGNSNMTANATLNLDTRETLFESLVERFNMYSLPHVQTITLRNVSAALENLPAWFRMEVSQVA